MQCSAKFIVWFHYSIKSLLPYFFIALSQHRIRQQSLANAIRVYRREQLAWFPCTCRVQGNRPHKAGADILRHSSFHELSRLFHRQESSRNEVRRKIFCTAMSQSGSLSYHNNHNPPPDTPSSRYRDHLQTGAALCRNSVVVVITVEWIRTRSIDLPLNNNILLDS